MYMYAQLLAMFLYTFFFPFQNNLSVTVCHQSANSIVQYARIARKHRLFGVCLDSLSKIHTMPSVPVMDCFQKIKQQVRKLFTKINVTMLVQCTIKLQ